MKATIVASFGENLRQARKARNITLQEISDTTKIGTRTLQALEAERFDLLPGGIFNKGFVRSYARCVGLDEAKTVAAYLAAANVATSETDREATSSQVQDTKREPWFAVNAAMLVGVLAIVVGLGLGGLWLKERHREADEQAASQRRVEIAAVSAAPQASIPPAAAIDPNAAAANVAATQTPNPTGPGGAANPPTGASPQTVAPAVSSVTPAAQNASKGPTAPVEVSISATARAWISVRSDGKAVDTLTLDPEKPEMSTRSYKAREKLILVVGNPLGLSVTYNGKPAGALGTVARRTTLTFTPEGMEKR